MMMMMIITMIIIRTKVVDMMIERTGGLFAYDNY